MAFADSGFSLCLEWFGRITSYRIRIRSPASLRFYEVVALCQSGIRIRHTLRLLHGLSARSNMSSCIFLTSKVICPSVQVRSACFTGCARNNMSSCIVLTAESCTRLFTYPPLVQMAAGWSADRNQLFRRGRRSCPYPTVLFNCPLESPPEPSISFA